MTVGEQTGVSPSEDGVYTYETSDWYRAETSYDDDVIGDDTVPELLNGRTDGHETVAQMYKGGVYDRALTPEAFPEAPDGEFEGLTYGEMRGIYRRLAAGFDALGVGKGDRIGMFAHTRIEWALSDLALLSRGAVPTSVYATSSPSQTRYLLDDPGASGVVVENQELLERVLEVEEDLDLDLIVSMDSLDGCDRDDIYTLADVYETGDEAFDEDSFDGWLDEISPDDLCTLIYTSGTTGQPKGVEISHRNFRSCLNQMWRRLGPRPDKPDEMITLNENLRVLSFLPLAHAFERFAHFAMLTAGATIAYAEDVEPDVLREDMHKVCPKGMATVPRLLEKIYDAVVEHASGSFLRRRIFDWAVGVGQDCWGFYESCDEPTGVAYYTRDLPPVLRAKHAVADRLVYSQIREALGGEIEGFLSAGGSLPEDLARTYLGMGLPVFEGYGMTEASPVVSVAPPEEPRVGKLGPPLCDVEVRVDEARVGTSVVEKDGLDGEVGELLVRGPNIFGGYWKKPDKTHEAFEDAEDGDEWFRTGDVVEVGDDGYLRFVDRVKNLLVLSTGKNVPAERVEDSVVASEYIDQCMLVGDEHKFVGALIVPNTRRIRDWADEEGLDLPEEDEELIGDRRVRRLLDAEIEEANSEFEEFEQVKKFRTVADEWTEENGLMTPTMKKKRREIRDRYAEEIRSIYAEE